MKNTGFRRLGIAALGLALTAPGWAEAACTTQTLQTSQTINGSLSNADCVDNNANGNIYYYDHFVFSGSSGQQLQMSASSSQIDPDLLLIAPDGSTVYDDDSGGGTTARIAGGLVQTGTYQVIVSSAVPQQSGSYTFAFSLGGGSGSGGGLPTVTGTAVEYFHAGFNHYFMTAYPEEAAAIDAGRVQGWSRTGQTYPVYAQGNASTQPVCRFFSTSFAPKSSHFYTPSPAECAAVKQNRDWQFEANAFFAVEPVAGACPSGTQPLYRVYNNGFSGAPNHRYTTCTTIRDKMLSHGWITEGTAMCVPAGIGACTTDASGGGTNYVGGGNTGGPAPDYGTLTGNSSDQAKFIAARGHPHLFTLGFVTETLDGSGRIVPLSPPKRIESWAYNDGSFTSALFENGYFMRQDTLGPHVTIQSTNLRPEAFSPGMSEAQVIAVMGQPSCVETMQYAGRALRYLRYRATSQSPVATASLENGVLVGVTAGYALKEASDTSNDICAGGNRVLRSGS